MDKRHLEESSSSPPPSPSPSTSSSTITHPHDSRSDSGGGRSSSSKNSAAIAQSLSLPLPLNTRWTIRDPPLQLTLIFSFSSGRASSGRQFGSYYFASFDIMNSSAAGAASLHLLLCYTHHHQPRAPHTFHSIKSFQLFVRVILHFQLCLRHHCLSVCHHNSFLHILYFASLCASSPSPKLRRRRRSSSSSRRQQIPLKCPLGTALKSRRCGTANRARDAQKH